MFLAAQGVCRLCKEPLPIGWHADHLVAFSKGGLTETNNGQALCAKCNLRKSDKYLFVIRYSLFIIRYSLFVIGLYFYFGCLVLYFCSFIFCAFFNLKS